MNVREMCFSCVYFNAFKSIPECPLLPAFREVNFKKGECNVALPAINPDPKGIHNRVRMPDNTWAWTIPSQKEVIVLDEDIIPLISLAVADWFN